MTSAKATVPIWKIGDVLKPIFGYSSRLNYLTGTVVDVDENGYVQVQWSDEKSPRLEFHHPESWEASEPYIIDKVLEKYDYGSM